MNDNARLDEIAGWEPKPSDGLRSDLNEYGFPTVVYRTPSRLVEECEKAFDTGLLLAALHLVVIIPDVCANIADANYREWCHDYLGLSNDGKKMIDERKNEKFAEEVSENFDVIKKQDIFTASNLYQLRCAIVHSASSVIEGKGEEYSSYKAIGVCVRGDAHSIIASYGHSGDGSEYLTDCAFDCVVNLEGLISLIAKGVCKFVEEDPKRDCEKNIKKGMGRRGVVDYRPITKTPFQGIRD